MDSAAGAGEEDVRPDDLPDGLVVADRRGLISCFNAEAGRLTGAVPTRMLGLPIQDALPLEHTDGRRWWRLTDPYDGPATRSGEPEHHLLLPGGREVLVTTRYLRAAPGGPLHRLVLSLRDAGARHRDERSDAELIATVAHELRSPLTSVKGFTATMLDKWERFTDDQKRLMLQTVDSDADRVTRLITELLDVSRIDSGRLEIRRLPIQLAEAARRHVETLVNGGQPAERFTVRAADDLPGLWADPDKIDQVLGNLLENAVRHGAGTITIELHRVPPSDHHQEGTAVTVSDEGPGIPEEAMHRVFTRFWRGSDRSGTGLGLYIVKGIVEAHGGTVTVGRGDRGGARFRFTLPAGTPAFMV
ncbi:ATP-binding protein [Streptomyces sp. JH002]|uniref:sensor histidine kinase n=1 Tax=Streptomyces TaxID=1883 RepID=UPI003687F6B0